MKLFSTILAVLFFSLQYRLWVSEGGMSTVWNLQHAITNQQTENHTLEDRNKVLEIEVKDLKQGMAVLEERARTELGMIKKWETFYKVVDE